MYNVMDDIQSKFKLKNDKVEPPSIYLGAKLRIRYLNTYSCWTMSSYDYVQAAIKNVERKLLTRNKKLTPREPTPMSSGYRLELDTSNELDADDTPYF